MTNYTDIRTQIKTGDLLLWRNHKGGAPLRIIERWLVRLGTFSPYIHVGLAWREGGRVWVMEMTTRGCSPRLLSLTGDFAWAPAPQPLSREALWYAQSLFGEWTYSRWQAVMGGIGRITIGNDAAGQCAEYALTVLQRCGKIKFADQPAVVTPQGLLDAALMQWYSPLRHVSNPRRDTIYPPDLEAPE